MNRSFCHAYKEETPLHILALLNSTFTDKHCTTNTMAGNKKKKPTMSITQPPPRASLTGIPPELRNTIYQHVVEDVEEVSISIRQLTKPELEDSHLSVNDCLRQSLSKHPLSQTCRQLRAEFDPIHKHKALITGVKMYNFDAENYEVDCLEDLAEVLSKTLLHSMSEKTKHGFRVRFLLDNGALESVLELEKRASTPGRISSGLQKLGSVTKMNVCHLNVVLLFRRKTTPLAAKRACLTHKDEQNTMRALKKLHKTVKRISRERRLGYTDDAELAHWLCLVHGQAHRSHRREQEVARAIESRKKIEIAHTKKIKNELSKALEGKSQMEKLVTLEEFLDGA